MTLNTAVYLHGHVDREDLYAFCNQLVGGTPRAKRHVSDKSINNAMGQGFDALMWIAANADGSPAQPEPQAHWEDCEPDCDYNHGPAFHAEITFDTPYGCGPAVLHAGYLVDLGVWLKGRGVEWSWRNEYTGDIHQGSEPEGFKSLMKSGDNADAWFTNVVLPRLPELAGEQS